MSLHLCPSIIYISSIFGHPKELLTLVDTLGVNSNLCILGNYFDLGPDPENILTALKQLQLEHNCNFFRCFHDESLLKLLGESKETADFRAFWVSPYLGTPLTIEKMGYDPISSYRKTGKFQLRHETWAEESISFVKKIPNWADAQIFSPSMQRLVLEKMRQHEHIEAFKINLDGVQTLAKVNFPKNEINKKIVSWVEEKFSTLR